MQRFIAVLGTLPFALSLACVPLAAAAETNPATSVTTYSAGVPETRLPQPIVFRVPTPATTLSKARFTPPAPSVSPLYRFQQEALVRSQRYAQQMAFEKRFGQGRPVKLRAPRY
jgi:hypothetical protein